MQKILSINVSIEPAEAVLAGISDRGIEVLERHSAPLGSLFHSDDIEFDGEVDLLGNAEDSDTEQPDPTSTLAPFADLLAAFKDSWSSSVLIVPSENYLSLTISLPFVDAKSINKVIDLEVQDLVPFDVSEFLIDHTVLGPDQNNPALFEVHVGMIPRRYIHSVIQTCKRCHFEPVAITSPASAIASFYHAAPGYFPDNAALVYLTEDASYACAAFNGQMCSDRAFLGRWLSPNGNGFSAADAHMRELKVALASAEHRYGKNLETIYFLGQNTNPSALQNHLGRNVEVLDTSDITRGASSVITSITAAAAMFVRDINPPTILSNFRTGVYAFRPQLKQLYAGLRSLTPYFLATILLLVGILAVRVFLTQYQISTLRGEIEDRIQAVAPTAAERGDLSIQALNASAQKVETELNGLGAPALLQPLEVFQQIARDVEKASVSINRIRITGTRAQVSGTASSYAAAEELGKIFRQNSDMYCSVSRDNAAGAGSSRGFEYTIELCD